MPDPVLMRKAEMMMMALLRRSWVCLSPFSFLKFKRRFILLWRILKILVVANL